MVLHAPEPQIPKGLVVLYLNLFKASTAPEGSKENINGGIKNMKKSKGMQLGAMLAVLLLVSLFASVASAQTPVPTSVPGNNSVSVNKALEHATVYMLRAVLTHTSGLEEWRGATINPEPLTLYDINGEKLFYEFSVEKNGNVVGAMKVSASRELGYSVRTFEIRSRPWNASATIEKAKDIVQKQYNGIAEIISAKAVVYGYPKFGIMVTLADQDGKKTRMFIDALDYSIVPDKEPGTDRIGVWSIYERISKENISQRIDEWDRDDKYVRYVMEKAKSAGISNLTQRTLSENELSILGKQGIVVPVSSNGIAAPIDQVILNVPMYYQENSVKCCVASAQMIAAYYFVSHTQDFIAGIMGCGVSGGCTATQELVYYKGAPPNGLGKTNSWDDPSPTWDKNRLEIVAGRPFRSGLPTHCRVGRGYKVDYDIWGTLHNYLYINDPYYWPIGGTYWEIWDSVTHADDLYVWS